MQLDLSQEVLVDFFLNVVGYLAAGGLMLIVHSLFLARKQRRYALSSASDISPNPSSSQDMPTTKRPAPEMEFIRLDDAGSSHLSHEPHTTQTRSSSSSFTGAHRNRIEVVGLARKMIEAGASAEKIRAVLPISEAELALLSSERK